MTTPNLAIPLIVASQNQKEVTANAAFTALDRAITGTFVADVAAGNVTLTAAQYREALGVRVINATVPARIIALPAVERYALVSVDGVTSTQDVTLQRGSTNVIVPAGSAALIRTDGTADGLAVILQRGDGAAGAENFLALTDAPDSYAGQALRLLRVNGDEDGLEFFEFTGAGAETFLDLTDTPGSYASQAGRAVVVKATRIINAGRPPARISDDPAWWECRLCEHHAVCHAGEMPERHCRSCLHATPVAEGAWHCGRHQQAFSRRDQQSGCGAHLYIPDLVAAEQIDAGEDWVSYRLPDGSEWRDSAPAHDPPVISHGPCNRCGANSYSVRPGTGPHPFGLTCTSCGHRGRWLGRAEAAARGIAA